MMVKIAQCEIECDFISPHEISKYYFSFLVLISKQINYESNEIVGRCHFLFDFVSLVRWFELLWFLDKIVKVKSTGRFVKFLQSS